MLIRKLGNHIPTATELQRMKSKMYSKIPVKTALVKRVLESPSGRPKLDAICGLSTCRNQVEPS